MKILVTGAAGFIGSNFVHYWAQNHPGDEILALDALTYCGVRESISDLENSGQLKFIHANICDREALESIFDDGIDVVVNFAAESHNSTALEHPDWFVQTNVVGTQTLIDVARVFGVERFHHISTCEVFGDLALDSPDSFREDYPYRPRTPYNAAKAGGDHIVRAYYETFGVPVTISICCNNYGPYQFPEKLIPFFTTNLLTDEQIPIYESSQNKREWIHVLDHCRAVDTILDIGEVGQTYNVGTGVEKSIDEVADSLLGLIGKPDSMKKSVPDREGHDRRYLLNSQKIETELSFKPEIPFEEGLAQTVQWYKDNPQWWEPLRGRSPVDELSRK